MSHVPENETIDLRLEIERLRRWADILVSQRDAAKRQVRELQDQLSRHDAGCGAID
jgi:uncharacterized coiled-coil DUF342 family protein